jgi:hypothetical protein
MDENTRMTCLCGIPDKTVLRSSATQWPADAQARGKGRKNGLNMGAVYLLIEVDIFTWLQTFLKMQPRLYWIWMYLIIKQNAVKLKVGFYKKFWHQNA